MRVADIWYNRIIRDSKSNDEKRKRPTDSPNYVTTDDLIRMLNEQQNKCNWCGVDMAWTHRRSTPHGLTLERFDNLKSHTRDNVCLCCKRCNSKRMTPQTALLRKYFFKWYRRVFDVKVIYGGDRRASLMWFSTSSVTIPCRCSGTWSFSCFSLATISASVRDPSGGFYDILL